MIKAIIFDCFGVLTADLWKEFVATLPESQVEDARALNRALDSGLISHAEFYKQISELTGRAPREVEKVTNSTMHKNMQLLDYITELKNNYKIGLLSNVSSDWLETFLTPQEHALFDSMVLSFEVGVIKPDPRIYQIAAEKLGVEPSEVVFIDDGEGNCEGAESVGMKSILYHDFRQLKADLEQLLHHV